MVNLNSIQPVAESPVGSTPAKARRGAAESAAPSNDSLRISSEALESSNLAQLARQAGDSEIRLKKVEEAKQRIQDGTHRLASIVNVVAERISGLVVN